MQRYAAEYPWRCRATVGLRSLVSDLCRKSTWRKENCLRTPDIYQEPKTNSGAPSEPQDIVDSRIWTFSGQADPLPARRHDDEFMIYLCRIQVFSDPPSPMRRSAKCYCFDAPQPQNTPLKLFYYQRKAVAYYDCRNLMASTRSAGGHTSGMGVEATYDYRKHTNWAQSIKTIQTDAATSQCPVTNGHASGLPMEVPCVLSERHLETLLMQRTDAQPVLCCLSGAMTSYEARFAIRHKAESGFIVSIRFSLAGEFHDCIM